MAKFDFGNPLAKDWYNEQRAMNPMKCRYDVDLNVASEDKIITVTEDGSLLAKISLDLVGNKLSLIGKDGNPFSSVDIPNAEGIVDVKYDEEREALIIIVKDGEEFKEIEIPFAEVLSQYAKKEEVQKNAEDIKTVNDNLVIAIHTINKNVADGFNTLNAGISGNEQRITSLEDLVNNDLIEDLGSEIDERKDNDELHDQQIKTLNDNLLKTIENYNQVVLPTIVNTINQSIMNETDARIKADERLEEIISGGSAEYATKEEVEKNAADIRIVNENLVTAINNINQNVADGFNTLNAGIKGNEIRIEELVKVDEVLANADEELKVKIEEEISRATQAEEELQSNIDELTNSVNEKEAELKEQIDSIKENVESIDLISVEKKIANEAIARAEADAEIKGMMATEVTRVNGMIDVVNTNTSKGFEEVGKALLETNNTLLAEIEQRKEGDATISSNLDTIKTNLEEVDSNLTNEINTLKSTKIDWTNVGEKMRAPRKALVLGNYDLILGTDTTGSTYNIAMVSKWDKVDLGTASLPFNMNGKEVRPTYNDSKEIALLEDVNGSIDSIALTKKDDLTYELTVGEKVVGSINIPKDTFLKDVSYKHSSKELVFEFETSNGVVESKVFIGDLVDVYTSGDGLALVNNKFSVVVDPTSEKYLSVSSEGIKLKGIENKITTIVNEAIKEQETEISSLLDDKVDWTAIPTVDTPKRKAVVLKNNDMVLGTALNGSAKNLIMINRWDVVDVGSGDALINLNVKKGERATVQEKGMSGEQAHKIAYLSDIEVEQNRAMKAEMDLESTISGIGDGFEEKFESINSKFAAYLPLEKAAEEHKAVLEQTKSYTDATSADEANKAYVKAANEAKTLNEETRVALGEVDARLSNRLTSVEGSVAHHDEILGMFLEEHGGGVNIYTKDEVNTLVEEEKTTRETSEAEINEKITSEIERATSVEESMQELISLLPKYTSYQDKKTIELANNDNISGLDTNGLGHNLVMLSKWNKADFGASGVEFNINGSAERPTYNDKKEIALLEDVEKLNDMFTLLQDKYNMLSNKFDSLMKADSEVISDFVGGNEAINDVTKSYNVENAAISETSDITAQSVVFNNASVSNDARLKINSQNVEFNKLNVNGDFPRANGNAVASLNNAEFVVFKDMTFNSENCYNGIEIGLSAKSETLPKNILFDNCKFEGTFSNNAILVFATQDNATITLNNCKFDKLSNALRLSNRTNASGVVVNIINCEVKQWDTSNDWSGFLILEDYTSKTAEEVNSNNLFGDKKISVNFSNLVYNGAKVLPSNVADVCGVRNENQVVYIWNNNGENGGFVEYDENKYPVISFK